MSSRRENSLGNPSEQNLNKSLCTHILFVYTKVKS